MQTGTRVTTIFAEDAAHALFPEQPESASPRLSYNGLIDCEPEGCAS